MNHRERVINTLNFKSVDRPAVEYLYTPVGFYEHGEKLNDLYEKHKGDFGEFHRQSIPVLTPDMFDKEGRFYQKITDDWGTVLEYRTYGIMGHASEFPVKTPQDAVDYTFPAHPDYITDSIICKQNTDRFKQNYFSLMGSWASICERMWAIRGFEQFMTDLYDDIPEINVLMDRLAEYYRYKVEYLVSAGAEGITMGDDYGTQDGLIFSKDMFKRLIKPRLNRIMEPARKAGLHIHFHSCGQISELFDDLKELGVKSIWPQLPVYDMKELRDAIKYYNFSLAIHTDRGVAMTHGTADEVKELVGLENEIFKPKDGGAWFYVECDTGFPFENMKALVETIYKI